MSSKQNKFSPQDRALLDRQAGVNWIPPDPQEVILPYIEKETPEGKTSLDQRREKAVEVMESYDRLIEESKRLEEEISNRCKKVKVTFELNQSRSVVAAATRIFGTREDLENNRYITEITFDMYKAAVQALAGLPDTIPEPENL